MCDKCLDIDYPIADVWRPCYVPRTRSQQARPYTPGEDEFLADSVANMLRWQLAQSERRNKRLVAEMEMLKARQPQVINGANSFEPIPMDEPHND